MRVPLPSVSRQPDQSTQFSAPAVTPQQDYTGQQLRGLGGAMQQAGDDTARLAAGLQDQYDEARTKEADMALAYAIDTDVGGYLQSVGKEATGDARKKALDAVAQKRRTIETSLGNQMQRQMFQKAADERMFRASSVSQKHEAQQTRVFSGSQSLARAQLLGQDAFNALMTGDHKAFQDAKGLMLSEVDAAATIAGASDEEKQLLRQGATTRLHGQIIEKLSNDGKGTAAADYLQGAKDEIAPDALLKLEGMVRQATVDQQSFEAARFLSQREPTLGKQIEALNQLVEDPNTKLSIEVRDAAERRLRGMEQIDYQEKARVGNETATQAEAFAAQNRVSTWDQLPLQMRQGLEASGRAEPFKVWLEQGQQFITTQRGIDIMRRAEDESWLRGQKIEALMASARDDLNRRDGDALIAAWYKAHQLPPPKGVGDAMVSMVLNRRMRELGYLPSDKEPTPEQTNRRNDVLESVQRALGTAPATQEQVDKAIEMALGETLSFGGGTFTSDKTMPKTAMTPKERESGYFVTRFGNVPANQVSPELVASRLQENKAVNAARMAYNSSSPLGSQKHDLLPETEYGIVQSLRAEQNDRKVARDAAYKDAMVWLRENRQELGKDAWHYLPDDLRNRVEATGMAPKARLDYEDYDKTHDFLGRPVEAWQSNPNSPMHNFSSPYGNR